VKSKKDMTTANAKPNVVPFPAGGNLGWYEVLHFSKCINCGEAKKNLKRGGTKTFCPFCEAQLPDVLAWHLDTARSNRWYMRWYRLACAYLRRGTR
jgi:hypothetical protein